MSAVDGTAAHHIRYWHGSHDPGLRIGVVLKSPAARGIRQRRQRSQPVGNLNFVYVSPDRAFARAFASLNGLYVNGNPLQRQSGTLYEVEPIGKLVGDTDFPGGISLACAEARVVGIAERSVSLDPRAEARILGPFYTYTDGRPAYSPITGLLQTAPEHRARGYTDSSFRFLGPWYPERLLVSGHADREQFLGYWDLATRQRQIIPK